MSRAKIIDRLPAHMRLIDDIDKIYKKREDEIDYTYDESELEKKVSKDSENLLERWKDGALNLKLLGARSIPGQNAIVAKIKYVNPSYDVRDYLQGSAKRRPLSSRHQYFVVIAPREEIIAIRDNDYNTPIPRVIAQWVMKKIEFQKLIIQRFRIEMRYNHLIEIRDKLDKMIDRLKNQIESETNNNKKSRAIENLNKAKTGHESATDQLRQLKNLLIRSNAYTVSNNPFMTTVERHKDEFFKNVMHDVFSGYRQGNIKPEESEESEESEDNLPQTREPFKYGEKAIWSDPKSGKIHRVKVSDPISYEKGERFYVVWKTFNPNFKGVAKQSELRRR